MRRISLIPYRCADGQSYKVRESLANLLFLPTLQLGAREIIEHDRIARKIESAKDNVVLEEAEFAKVKQAIEAFKGYGRDDLQLIARVMDAAELDANTNVSKGDVM
jgi:predicted glycosyltransferase involved in capsule biosynthesis